MCRRGIQGLARASEIYHKAATIFLTLVFSVLLPVVSRRLQSVGQTWLELVLSILP